MKKVFYLLCAAIVLTACQKDPDFSELSTDYMVFTTYKSDYTFTGSKTIFVPQTILLPGTAASDNKQWSDANSTKILDEFVTKFQAAGYTVTRDPEAVPDLYLMVSYLEDANYFVDYPYWWWDPYWWNGGFWPAWYYPYPVVYGYTVGSLIGELVLPDSQTTLKDSKTLPSVWYTYIGGDQYGSKAAATPYIIKGVDKAFAQSPELKK